MALHSAQPLPNVFVGIIVGVAMFGLGVVNDNLNARFAAIEDRLDKLEENQQEMALTLTRLVTLLEADGVRIPPASG